MRVLPRAGEPLDLRLVPAGARRLAGRLAGPAAAAARCCSRAARRPRAARRRAAAAAPDDGRRCRGPRLRRRVRGRHRPARRVAHHRAARAGGRRRAPRSPSRRSSPTTRAARRATRELVVVRLRVVELRAAGRAHRPAGAGRGAVVRPGVARPAAQPAGAGRTDGCGRPSAATTSPRCCRPAARRRCCRRRRACSASPARLRAGLREAVAPLPAAERGLLPGLVVGDTSRLDDDAARGLPHRRAEPPDGRVGHQRRDRDRRGPAARPAARGRACAAARCWRAVALAGFVVLARPSPSVLRAAVMGVVGLAALSTGGRRAAVPALATAVLVLVLVDPDLAAAPGFALSVLATAGLLVLAPGWRAGAGAAAAGLARRRAGGAGGGAGGVRAGRRRDLRPSSACCRCRPTCSPSRRSRRRRCSASPRRCWRRCGCRRRRPSPGSAGCRRPGSCWSPAPARGCPARRRPGRRARRARCCSPA